jgi:uridylate kinase
VTSLPISGDPFLTPGARPFKTLAKANALRITAMDLAINFEQRNTISTRIFHKNFPANKQKLLHKKQGIYTYKH